MWAYRIDKQYSGPTLTQEQVRKHLNYSQELAFEKALRLSIELCKHIGWDGTYRSDVCCWAVPGLKEMAPGFIFQDLTGRTFIVSPISLPHLAKGLDWDAMVSHEEIAQAQRAIKTGNLTEQPAAVLTQFWQVSRSGNLFGKVNGAAVTVFSSDIGYKAVCNPIGKSAVYTRAFSEQQECCDYVLRHWYEIINSSDPGDEPEPDW